MASAIEEFGILCVHDCIHLFHSNNIFDFFFLLFFCGGLWAKQKFLEETEEKLEPELRPDVLERNWNQLLLLHQERDAAIHKEMERLERLQRIAEKVHREAKQSDARLDEVEARIDEEAKRLDRLHPRDAMKNCEVLNAELASIEETIKIMFTDVQALKDGRYNQTADLHKRVQRIHQRWQSIRAVFQTRLVEVLPSLTSPDAGRSSRSSLEARLFETNEHFRFLRECSEWVRSKLVNFILFFYLIADL